MPFYCIHFKCKGKLEWETISGRNKPDFMAGTEATFTPLLFIEEMLSSFFGEMSSA